MDVLIADVLGDIGLVLAVGWLFGQVARRCGQPAVVGQIIAGIAFGPSGLGHLPGHLDHRLFPHAVLPVLNSLSQVAVVVFMFVIGYEIDRQSLRLRRRVVMLVATSCLVVPMVLGIAAVLAFRSLFAAVGQPHVGHSFILFMGVAVSITALPVLAAIVRERGIADTTAGVTAVTAAGVMDVAAWLVLAAALVGTAGRPGRPWPVTLLLICAFTLVMLLGVRPALRWWMGRANRSNLLPLALMLALGTAWVTASLGLHPVFGGFLAGLTMPTAQDAVPDAEIRRPMEDIAALFLPLFFVVTGLSVNLSGLNGDGLIMLLLVGAIAMGGKVGPAYAASRVGGLGTADSITVAVLVSARGLTELIALNVGLSSGLIGTRLFSVLVVMAVLTTMATAPLLSISEPGQRRPRCQKPRWG